MFATFDSSQTYIIFKIYDFKLIIEASKNCMDDNNINASTYMTNLLLLLHEILLDSEIELFSEI